MATRWRRFRGLFGLDPGRDVEDELSFHLDMRIRELIDRGESPERARELALRRFGNLERSRLECVAINERRRRRMRRADFITDRGQDIRYALRMFRRAPGFTTVAVLTLAFGIGANVAVFALFNRLLLEPLPVPEPSQLVNLVSPGPRSGPTSCGSMGGCEAVFSYPMFRDLERVQTVFTGLAAHRDFSVNLSHRGQTTTGRGLFVSGSYFPVLGLRPTLGRLLGSTDDRTTGESEVVVLSHAYWQSHLGGRRDVVDETIVVNGQPMTIVGVAPKGFEGTTLGLRPEVFMPITIRWRLAPDPRSPPENRRGYWVYLFARLKPGVALEQARAAIDMPYRVIINEVEVPLQEGMSDRMMAQFKGRGIRLNPGSRGQSSFAADARAPLTLFLAVTILVLLIACVNVAHLLLARATVRSKELATRLALGATRARLIAQLFSESSVLAFAAAVASLLIARWTIGLFRMMFPDAAPLPELQQDTSTLIVTGALALGTSVAVGLFPTLHAARRDPLSALKAQAGQPGGSRGAARFRVSLATAQVALSIILIVLAGLFTKSLANLSRVDPGLRTDGLVTFRIAPQRNGYTLPRSAALFGRLEEELAALPGVTAVTSSTTPLLSGDVRITGVFVEGYDAGPDADRETRYDEIGHGYFRTLGVPLIFGREFTSADSENAAKVAIINEQFAKKFGLAREAVGKGMSRDTPSFDLEIVGVVRDFKHSDLRDATSPLYFVPHRQGTRRPGLMIFYVRTSLNADETMAAIRRVMLRLDQHLPIEELRTMDEAMRGATTRERLMGVMTGAFATLATLVAAIGLYGLLAFAVAQRTSEIGLRMALGATRVGVRWMVLRQVGMIVMIGGTLGLAFAMVLGRAAQALLFGLHFHDPVVLASSIFGLILVGLAAGFVPASRAARIDPMRALKYE
ncbi:MAG: ABC transporter permease [Acidobacteria bacterium]|nr:ABC transporter permease [Acidobacteriota bacterium]